MLIRPYTLHIPNDYYAYCGINRPVTVEEVGNAMQVVPRKTADGWTAEARVFVRKLSDCPFHGALRLRLAGKEATEEIEIQSLETAYACFLSTAAM